jgi:hypothetical protein
MLPGVSKPSPFAILLTRRRREAGFANAHSFYKARDGRRTFGLSFPNYMALESGASLPRAWRLEAILAALNLTAASPAWKELVRAYLTSLLGSDALLRGLESAPGSADLSSDEAARQSLRQRSAQLDLAQLRLLAADAGTYYCHIYLVNTPGWSSVAEIAKAVGLPATKARSALKALAGAKVAEVSAGRARSPFAYKYLAPLPILPTTAHIKSRLIKFRDSFSGERGALKHRNNITTRMTKANLDHYLHRLTETVALSSVFGDAEKADDTDVYFIDARVYRIFD